MNKIIVLALLMLACLPCHAQQAIAIKNFTPAQKAEWNRFMDNGGGNGNGTCMPIMEAEIRKGRCDKFAFTADVSIGKDGRIKKVQVLQSRIVCEDKAIQKELLKCFVQAFHDDPGTVYFHKLRNHVVRNAVL